MAKEFLDRDISWMSWNDRVLDESTRKRNRTGERVNFLGIAGNNLAEWFRVRYPARLEEDSGGLKSVIAAVGKHYKRIMTTYREFNRRERLVRRVKDLSDGDRRWARDHFRHNIYPTLLPVTADKTRAGNIRSGMYVLALGEREDGEVLAYVEIPASLGRFVRVPGRRCVVAVEDLVRENLETVFRGMKILKSCPFTVLRSAEVYAQTDRNLGPYEAVAETLRERERSWITALEIGSDSGRCARAIQKLVNTTENTFTLVASLIRIGDLTSLPKDILRESELPRRCKIQSTWPPDLSVFDIIHRRDRLCFHPYESYDESVVRFVEEAAVDRRVRSIRITLYRVSDNSRIVDALLRAADAGKLVVVLVELKARFDEKHNMHVSSVLREGGVRIIYTRPDIKTHAKLCLVTREEKKGLRVYAHVGTGNYSESNSRLYTDYSFFTDRSGITGDLVKFFNILTSDQDNFRSRQVLYAPHNLKKAIVEEIERQGKRGRKGRIIVKCNALTDPGVAGKLLAAAENGCAVTLIVRSACIIQPGGNIDVCSIVGRELEHSRILVFGRDKPDIFIGSSDLMTRNLDRRNELLVRMDDPDIRRRILGHIELYLRDTENRRIIGKNYKYEEPGGGGKSLDCHREFEREAKRLSAEG